MENSLEWHQIAFYYAIDRELVEDLQVHHDICYWQQSY